MANDQIDKTDVSIEPWICVGAGLSTGLLLLPFNLFFVGTTIGFFGYAMRLLWKFRKTEKWIHQARVSPPPPPSETSEVWSTIGYDVEWILNRHQKEIQRLQTVVGRVKDMAAALTDSVIRINRKGTMDWWNAAAQNVFEFRESDRGHKLTNLIRHPKFIEYFENEDYDAPLQLTMWQMDLHLEFQVHTYGDGERLVVIRDITRLFKLEQMRKDFVANVSHELRTPLTVIKGYLETLEDSGNLPPKWGKCLAQMQQQSDRMTVLIDDLITLTKLETDEKDMSTTPVDVEKLLSGIANDARALASNKHLQFTLTGDAGFFIHGSERELRSAISNLVVNAINYSNDNAEIELSFELRANDAVISVRDNGIGIDPKHIPRLTERFYRVDTSRSVVSGGTGLGLAIVKHVLIRHNGDLKITSKLGKGSTFSCHFPLSRVQPNHDDQSRVANS